LEDPERKIKDVSSVKEALEDELSFCYYEWEKEISLISKSACWSYSITNIGTIITASCVFILLNIPTVPASSIT
jgi:hypothetical protein